MSETLLDMKGANCPLPVLRANRVLRSMASGERLRVLATDRASVADFQAFCRETGHALLAWSEEGGVFSFVIRRRADRQVVTDTAIARPGDTLVVGVAGQVTAEEADRVREGLRQNLPGVDVFLISPVSQLVVYRPDEEQS